MFPDSMYEWYDINTIRWSDRCKTFIPILFRLLSNNLELQVVEIVWTSLVLPRIKLFKKIEEILKLKPFAYKENYSSLYHTTFILGKFTISQWFQIAKRDQDMKNGFFVRGILIVRYFDVDDSFGYSDNVPMETPQKVLLLVSAQWSQIKDRRLHSSHSFHVRKYDVKEQNAKYITSTTVN